MTHDMLMELMAIRPEEKAKHLDIAHFIVDRLESTIQEGFPPRQITKKNLQYVVEEETALRRLVAYLKEGLRPGEQPDPRLKPLEQIVMPFRQYVRQFKYRFAGDRAFALPYDAIRRLGLLPAGRCDRACAAVRVMNLLDEDQPGILAQRQRSKEELEERLGQRYPYLADFVDCKIEVSLDLDIFIMLHGDTWELRGYTVSEWMEMPWKCYCGMSRDYTIPLGNYTEPTLEMGCSDSCMICLEPFKHEVEPDSEAPRLTRCGHIIGSECLKTWVSSKSGNSDRCPKCRAELFRSPLDKVPKVMWEPVESLIAAHRRIVALDDQINHFLLIGPRDTYDVSMGPLLEEMQDIWEKYDDAWSEIFEAWEGWREEYLPGDEDVEETDEDDDMDDLDPLPSSGTIPSPGRWPY